MVESCTACGGWGYIEVPIPGDEFDREGLQNCEPCHGTGSIDEADHLDNVDPVDHDYQLPEVKPDAPRP